jgi:hypothetical protein
MSSDPFREPAAAILCGYPGSLLDWVAYGFASTNKGGYFWTDVRMPGQLIDEADPLARGRIPPDHLNVVEPHQLTRNDVPANAAISALIREEESRPSMQLFVDFLRLPLHTQRLISEQQEGPDPILLILSNAQRIAAQFPTDTVGPVVRAIVGSGVSLLLVFPDEPPAARLAFENVWHIHGEGIRTWRTARLEIERGNFAKPFTTGLQIPLPEIACVAPLLKDFEPPRT